MVIILAALVYAWAVNKPAVATPEESVRSRHTLAPQHPAFAEYEKKVQDFLSRKATNPSPAHTLEQELYVLKDAYERGRKQTTPTEDKH